MKALSICLLWASLALSASAQFDHRTQFPDFIKGQLNGAYGANVKWFNVGGRDIYIHFFFTDIDTVLLQAEYYPLEDSLYAFRGYWRNAQVHSFGLLKVGPPFMQTDTVVTFDPETYEEKVITATGIHQKLLKQGIWDEFDSLGNHGYGSYHNGLREGIWNHYDSIDILQNVQEYRGGQLLKDSSTNVMLSRRPDLINNTLIGNWIVDYKLQKLERTTEDFSAKRMPPEYKAWFRFNPDHTLEELIYVGCKFINGGMASGVQERHKGTWQFLDYNTLECHTNGKTRTIKLCFLSTEAMLWSEGLR